ncbi:hypothetical protein RvY_10680 [Ramazzottius varieornatus]|uniref:Uncharacterized protein n=1 Tax=Ramazzottius varieornatus TaxID=947166 RepID=A0A1D1VI18_RAMVA|nr:hypothetical protein RvY_10680 [Ramazzottius varieornatus]
MLKSHVRTTSSQSRLSKLHVTVTSAEIVKRVFKGVKKKEDPNPILVLAAIQPTMTHCINPQSLMKRDSP